MNIFAAVEGRFRRWLSAPAPNAAGRIGLGRIGFCLFELWIMSRYHMTEIPGQVIFGWNPPVIFAWLPVPSVTFLGVAESLLAGILILLLIGYRVRLMTLALLIVGIILAAMKTATFTLDRTTSLTFFFVPFVMLMSDWGCTYSLDALLKQRRGEFVPLPDDPSWRYIWPMRALLLILATLFFSAGVIKVRLGDWLKYSDWLATFLSYETVRSYFQNGTPMNPLVPLLEHVPWLLTLGQYGVIVFEVSFPLVLIEGFFRQLYLRLLPLFHIFNAFMLGIPFTFTMGFYPFFVDWQKLRPDLLRLPFLARLTESDLIGGTAALAVLTALLWDTSSIPRGLFSLGGLLNDNYSVWGVVFLGWLIWNLVEGRTWPLQRRLTGNPPMTLEP